MKRPIKPDDFLNNHTLSNLKVDDAQSFGLYFEHTPDLETNRYSKNINLIDLNTFKITKIELPFEADDYCFKGKNIILKKHKDSGSTFFSYDILEQEILTLFNIPFIIDKFTFSETKLFFTAEVQGVDINASVKCSDRGPFFKEGRGVLGDGITGLFESELDGKDINLITSLDMDLDQVDFDFENNRITFTAFSVKNLKPVSSEVYLYDLTTESINILMNQNYRISYIQSMTDEFIIIMGINLDQFSRNDNQQIFTININSGKMEALGAVLTRSNEVPAVATDAVFLPSLPIQKFNGAFYFKQVERDREVLCRIDMEGNCEVIDTGLTLISSYRLIDDGIIIIGLNGLQLSEVYLFANGIIKQISSHNKWTEELVLSNAERIKVHVDNVEIDGFVFPPDNIKPGELYPAVLLIHGGPKMIYSDVFSHDIQLLCANGYYVFCANPMGSDGRGDHFSNIRSHFGDLPYKQLMFFTDQVLEQYQQIDKNHLGVSGGSYGGYMTNYIITRTTRFKAAVSERGISNLMTAFTSSDIGYQLVFEYMGNESTPWSDPESAIEASPIYMVHNVKTPTLFIHGKDDYRCHYTESLNMFAALNYIGVESRMCLFEDESHSLAVGGKPQSKMRRFEEHLSWYNKFLKPGEVN